MGADKNARVITEWTTFSIFNAFLFVCLSVYLSICLFVCMFVSLYLSILKFQHILHKILLFYLKTKVFERIKPFFHRHVKYKVNSLSVFLFVCLFVVLCVCFSLCLFFFMYVFLYVSLSVYLYFCMSISLSHFICLVDSSF